MTQKKDTIWTHNFTILFFTNIVAYFGQSMLNSLLQIHGANLGIGTALIGTIVGLSSFSALCMRPFAGSVIDSVNKKKLFLACQIIFGLSTFGFAIARNSVTLILFRLTYGIGMGFSGPLGLTMATDSLPKTRIASGVGFYGLGSIISQAVGPAVGLAIESRFGAPIAFTVAGLLTFAGVLIATRLEYTGTTKKLSLDIRNTVTKYALVPATMSFLVSLGYAGINSFLVLYARTKGIDNVSIFYTLNALGMLATRPLTGKLSDKFGPAKILYPGLIVYALTMVVVAKMSNYTMLCVIALLFAVGYGASYTLVQALGIKVVPPSKRGAGTNTLYVGTDAAMLVGSSLAGAIVTATSYETMYLMSAVAPILAMVILFLWTKKNYGIPEAVEEE